ncbi:hypothetical protein AWV77_25525 [Pseudomonas palleroniana]|uniref:Uncharacterized protein n=1 Tax=Pseudomonas palleroniana TaxID=191390 RepID=A0A0X7JXW9_9PSED|nr:hypothetical protein AWV77_25525 [Pseudomonas palleroniana]
MGLILRLGGVYETRGDSLARATLSSCRSVQRLITMHHLIFMKHKVTDLMSAGEPDHIHWEFGGNCYASNRAIH